MPGRVAIAAFSRVEIPFGVGEDGARDIGVHDFDVLEGGLVLEIVAMHTVPPGADARGVGEHEAIIGGVEAVHDKVDQGGNVFGGYRLDLEGGAGLRHVVWDEDRV